jgi:hypothetical protein
MRRGPLGAVIRGRCRVVSRVVLLTAAFALGACSVNNGPVPVVANGTDSTNALSASPIQSEANDLVDATPSPQVLTYFRSYVSDKYGQIELTPILDISSYHTVNLEIIAGTRHESKSSLRVQVYMGKIQGTTLSQLIDHYTIEISSTRIHSYDVIGPDLLVWIMGAPANTKVDVQAWVFLH